METKQQFIGRYFSNRYTDKFDLSVASRLPTGVKLRLATADLCQAEGKIALAKAGKIFLQMFIIQCFSAYKQNAQEITA